MTYVIGVDPGPMVGIVGFYTEDRRAEPDVIQCNAGSFTDVLDGVYIGADTVLAAERFVESRLAMRGNSPAARALARSVLERCEAFAASRLVAVRYVVRSAAEVKPWATDTRLLRAGLLKPTTGMRHARDAARHALFAAVKDCGMPDPLSKRAAVTP